MFEEIKIPSTKNTFYIKVWLKTYELKVWDTVEKDEIYIECRWANLSQPYPKNDLHIFLKDIPWMIEDHQSEKKDSLFQIRLTAKQKLTLEKNAIDSWYKYVSDFIKEKCITK